MRTCESCGVDQRIGEFYQNSDRGGYHVICRTCSRARRKAQLGGLPRKRVHNQKSHTAVRSEMVDAVNGLPYSADDWSWYVVESHPAGLALDAIAQLLGLTRERVRQIEARAVAKIKHGLGPDVAVMLSALTQIRDASHAGKGRNVSS